MLAFTPTSNPQEIQARQQYLARLNAKFSDTGKGYRSLNKTLVNFQDSLHLELMGSLRYTHLEREIKEPLELFTLLNAIKESRMSGKALNPLWKRATRAQIEKAMGIILHEYTCSDISVINAFVNRLVVYEPPNFTGGIVGLAEKVNKAFQEKAPEMRKQIALSLGLNTKLARPRVVPDIQGTTFIETVGQLWEEGKAMDNCAVEYARQAIDGEYYFFHIEKDGDSATTRIRRGGFYVCEGRDHAPNAATRWAWWKNGDAET